jgi:glycyl-tRNA synthetase beta chain
MTGELLFEIGTEEIPSDFLDEGIRRLQQLAESAFRDNLIQIQGKLKTFGTPRRLVLFAEAVAETQDDTVQEITGPPKSAAFDSQGNPTKAALGFAKKQGIPVNQLGTLQTPKGEYLYVKRRIPGRPTPDVLTEVLPRIISDISWPKSMRWGSIGFPFVRPIHWLLALFQGNVIPFQIAGISSENKTRGHRFMAPRILEVTNLQDYFRKMAESSVVINQEERKHAVKEAVTKAAKAVSGTPMEDAELLSTVTNLVEFPSAVCGSFDEAFLNLPDPVLITAMKKHQKYFAVYNGQGLLMPHFVAVNNTVPRNESVVRKGHERVLRARLADADFFFKEDRKGALLEKLEDLKGVIYQADLGTSYAKVQRFMRLAEYLAEQVSPGRVDDVTLAAKLCKCDLVSEMVMEFPTLQGVMGEEYARLDGHPEEICLAVREHYLPDRAGGELPTSPIGALVGMADRLDTITGCFAVGLEPTGAADPFALRRHALAIIGILEAFAWDLSLQDVLSRTIAILSEEVSLQSDLVFEKVLDFFRERYKQLLLRSDHKSDLIEAVVSVAFDQISPLRERIQQLEKFSKESKEFESLVLAFKRVNNILKKQKEERHVNPDQFREPCETHLWQAYQEIKDDAQQKMEGRNYYEALELMARLRKPVDDLFDGVEILTKEDPDLKNNRVAMLQALARLFLSLADFSKFSI